MRGSRKHINIAAFSNAAKSAARDMEIRSIQTAAGRLSVQANDGNLPTPPHAQNGCQPHKGKNE